ncbi:MAG: hypothetical protein ABI180_09380 [Microcoleus sp.]|jgi:hypothetical protein
MTATAMQSIDWDAFCSELSEIEIIRDRAQDKIRRLKSLLHKQSPPSRTKK